MNSRKLVTLLSFFVLGLSLWLIARIQQQRQEAEIRTRYYATILGQAPCIENVCPGYSAGRNQALASLSNSSFVEGSEQGDTIIGLFFKSDSGAMMGSGGIYFAVDSQVGPLAVRRTSFRLHELDLKTVLNILGEPDEFLFISGCGMGLRVHAKLLYLSQGVEVVVDYLTRQPASQVLTGNTPVAWIEYYSPSDFQNHIMESLEWHILDTVTYDLSPTITANSFLQQIQQWPGIDALPTPTADFCPR